MAEVRKLQKTGGSTLIVSLPKNWVSKEKLDRGSTVTIKEQKDGSLVLTPGTNETKDLKEVEITADDNLSRHLVEKYLLGYDILKLKSEKNFDKQKAELKKTLQKLVGLEIMEETANSLTIHSFLDPEEVSILKSLRRMHTIVSVMHKDLIQALENKDKKLLEDVIQRDEEANRMYFLVVRQIRTVIQNSSLQDKEGIRAVDCVDYRLVAKIIEQMGDRLGKIAKDFISSKFKNSSIFSKPIKDTLEIHKLAAQSLFKKDVKTAQRARKLRKKVSFDINIKKEPTQLRILNNVTRLADSSVDLADIVVSE